MISDADIDRIKYAILGYKNSNVNGDKDLYQVISDGSLFRDSVKAPDPDATPDNKTWYPASYLREEYLLSTRVENALGDVAKAVADLKAAVDALPKAPAA